MLPFRPADVPVADSAQFATGAPYLVPVLAHVHATVVAHATARRAAGVPAERVVVEVRTLMRAAAAGLPLRNGREREAMHLLLAAVVRWSVAAYGAAEFAPSVATLEVDPFAAGPGTQRS